MVMGYDEERCAILFQHLDGQTATDRMMAGDDHAPLLLRAGQWLSAFHRSGQLEFCPFRGIPVFNKLEATVKQIEAGQRSVPVPAAFMECAAELKLWRPRLQNCEAPIAVRHGDMHCRNLIVKGDICWGIDFGPEFRLPAAFDVARLLVDYATNFPPSSEVRTGQIMAPHLLGAFFRGYELFGPDNEVFQVFLRSRVLANWLALGRAGDDDLVFNKARLRGFESVAGRLFGIAPAQMIFDQNRLVW